MRLTRSKAERTDYRRNEWLCDKQAWQAFTVEVRWAKGERLPDARSNGKDDAAGCCGMTHGSRASGDRRPPGEETEQLPDGQAARCGRQQSGQRPGSRPCCSSALPHLSPPGLDLELRPSAWRTPPGCAAILPTTQLPTEPSPGQAEVLRVTMILSVVKTCGSLRQTAS